MEMRLARMNALVKSCHEAVAEASFKLNVKTPYEIGPKPEFIDPLDAAEQAPFVIRQLLTLVDVVQRRLLHEQVYGKGKT